MSRKKNVQRRASEAVPVTNETVADHQATLQDLAKQDHDEAERIEKQPWTAESGALDNSIEPVAPAARIENVQHVVIDDPDKKPKPARLDAKPPSSPDAVSEAVAKWAEDMPNASASWRSVDNDTAIAVQLSTPHGTNTHKAEVDGWSAAQVRKALDKIRAEQIRA